MSNAAVVKLQKKIIGRYNVWMDDNFGESVHLHMNDFRADMSRDEFDRLYEDTCDSIDALIDVEGFHARDFDPVFLEQMLWLRLPRLEKIVIDEVFVADLWAGGKHIAPLGKSRVYKALSGNDKKAKVARPSDRLGQGSADRIREIDHSIESNGYDTSKGYIVLFGGDNIVRDGQHRACSILRSQGNVKVPVMRMYFRGDKDYNVKLRGMLHAPSFRMKDVHAKLKAGGYLSLSGMKKQAIRMAKWGLAKKDQIGGKVYLLFHKKQQAYVQKILSSK